MLRELLIDEQGVDLVDYALIMACITLAATALYCAVGSIITVLGAATDVFAWAAG